MSKYICIEGNIGAGKTTLAKILSERLNARLILEEFEENAFLPKFYEQPERYAFPLEMSFLADRYHQLSKTLNSSKDLFREHFVSDYTLVKSKLFAGNNLKGHELKLYNDFFHVVSEKLRKPDLVVFLQRPLNSIVKQINQRGRDFEKNMDTIYLQEIGERYQNLIKSEWGAKCLIINADSYDFIYRNEDVENLLNQVEEVLNISFN
jgi:deoxyadenosine/deoxycytidine kinase